MKSRLILAGSAALVGLVAVIIFAFAQPYTLHGSVIDPARPAPPLSLHDIQPGPAGWETGFALFWLYFLPRCLPNHIIRPAQGYVWLGRGSKIRPGRVCYR